MSNVIYIELTAQSGGILIALPVGDIEYHQPYDLVKVQYATDVRDNIKDSKFFSQHPISELPESITEMFDYKRYAENAICFYKEIVQGPDKLKIASKVINKLATAVQDYNELMREFTPSIDQLRKIQQIKENLKEVKELSEEALK